MPSHAHVRLLQELNETNARARACKPSAARMFSARPGNSSAAMRAKLEESKAGSARADDIEAKMRQLKAFTKSQKRRTALQAHQHDWYRTNTALRKERAQLEIELSSWLDAQIASTPAQRSGAPADEEYQLAMRAELAAADIARSEWRAEITTQLRDLAELCATPGAAHVGGELLRLTRDALSQQGERLASAAAHLEHEIAQHVEAGRLHDGVAGARASGTAGGDVLGVLGLESLVSPDGPQSDGERKLLQVPRAHTEIASCRCFRASHCRCGRSSALRLRKRRRRTPSSSTRCARSLRT